MSIADIDRRLRPPKVGNIRLGVRVPTESGGKRPKALGYFVFPEGKYKESARAVYGDEPRLLDVILPSDGIDRVADTFFRRYNAANELVCKGDGERADLHDKEGGIQEIECSPKSCESYQKGDCRETLFLYVIVPKVVGIGVWKIESKGIRSIMNVRGALKTLGGREEKLAGIPCKLAISAEQYRRRGIKGLQTRYVLHLLTPDVCLEDLDKYRWLREGGPALPEPAEPVPPAALTSAAPARVIEGEATAVPPRDEDDIVQPHMVEAPRAPNEEERAMLLADVKGAARAIDARVGSPAPAAPKPARAPRKKASPAKQAAPQPATAPTQPPAANPPPSPPAPAPITPEQVKDVWAWNADKALHDHVRQYVHESGLDPLHVELWSVADYEGVAAQVEMVRASLETAREDVARRERAAGVG